MAIQDPLTVVYQGKSGPGKGKHIVFLAGDEEYRSEEGLPQLAAILAFRHGFKCTVVFSINEKGEIDPNVQTNQPGIEALDSADLCVMLLRFRKWPDAQMAHFVDFYRRGKPIIALRTSTHAFDFASNSTYAEYGLQAGGGFGKKVLGETWVSHWGNHGSQATRGVAVAKHPILAGVESLFGTTDVYEASPPADAQILLRGQVLSGMNETDAPAAGRKKTVQGKEQDLNDPMMPIVWLRNPTNPDGKTNQILTSTMGAATDLLDHNQRRLLVNGAFWMLGLKVPRSANVGLVGQYQPTKFGFNAFRRGVRPADLARNAL
jgi:hypothetical protein